jgi:hypothetical protein
MKWQQISELFIPCPNILPKDQLIKSRSHACNYPSMKYPAACTGELADPTSSPSSIAKGEMINHVPEDPAFDSQTGQVG